jgi:hypothetical protein
VIIQNIFYYIQTQKKIIRMDEDQFVTRDAQHTG